MKPQLVWYLLCRPSWPWNTEIHLRVLALKAFTNIPGWQSFYSVKPTVDIKVMAFINQAFTKNLRKSLWVNRATEYKKTTNGKGSTPDSEKNLLPLQPLSCPDLGDWVQPSWNSHSEDYFQSQLLCEDQDQYLKPTGRTFKVVVSDWEEEKVGDYQADFTNFFQIKGEAGL